MTYPEAINYLESFIDYEKIPAYPYKETLTLKRIKGFLSVIDNPQDSLSCLHIAGTKGKGSTCAFIAYILRASGYRAGLYTSPHLSDFRERIRILTPGNKKKNTGADFEGMIRQQEISRLTEKLKPAINRYNKSSKYGPLSFFEVYTALAFVYFKQKKVDFAVLETGLGGRLDATNVINPLICAITAISYEHTQKLGNTLKEISQEKAGIIKSKGAIVITAAQEKDALRVLSDKCASLGAKLFQVGRDITYQNNNHSFKVEGILGEYTDLRIKLIGRHQLANAALAVGAVELLRFYNVNIGPDAIRRGLYNTFWPGRCEIISENPLFVIDGAQNIASAKALREAIKENFKYKRLILVLGISNDKDKSGICGQLSRLADEVILTRADNPRAADPQNLAGYFSGKRTHITANIKEAKDLARKLAKKEDLVLATGSLFVAGEFRDDKK